MVDVRARSLLSPSPHHRARHRRHALSSEDVAWFSERVRVYLARGWSADNAMAQGWADWAAFTRRPA